MCAVGEGGAALLVTGVVELLYKSAGQGIALPKLPSGHPFFKSLCAHPSARPQLLACLEALIAQPDETPETRRQWLQWQPFISLVLLDHGEGEAKSSSLSCMENVHNEGDIQHRVSSNRAKLDILLIQKTRVQRPALQRGLKR